MSHTLETAETPSAAEAWSPAASGQASPSQEYGDFAYRPMPVLAPVAGVFGVCSLVAYLGLFGIGIAFLGVPISLVAVFVILRSRGALSGMWIALAGLLLCTTNTAGGIGLQVYHFNHEVPEGFPRVNFATQISKPGFITDQGEKIVPPEVVALVDKPLFTKGFMYPTEQTEDLSHFLLLKDSGQCCFGGKPALEDMIGVMIEDDTDVDYYAGRVAVAGTLKVNTKYQGGSLEPIYLLELEHFSPARTSF